MLDIRMIRDNPEAYRKACTIKNFDSSLVDQLLEIDTKIKPLKQSNEELLAKRNQLSKQIGKIQGDERQKLIAEVGEIKSELESKLVEQKKLEASFKEVMLKLPAPTADDVPTGKDDQDNVEDKTWGEIPNFNFKIKSHIELGEQHDIIDFTRAVNISGSRSYILKGFGAELEQAILRLTFDSLLKKSYQAMSVPVLVRESAMEGTGYFPIGREQAYIVEKDELVLVGTSEVSLASYFANQTLSENRARTCANYLISKGITSRRIASQGYGETNPVATNDTPEGRRMNRRVEFDLNLR